MIYQTYSTQNAFAARSAKAKAMSDFERANLRKDTGRTASRLAQRRMEAFLVLWQKQPEEMLDHGAVRGWNAPYGATRIA